MKNLGKINAYIMAADPAFLVESVQSYYNIVSRIIVTYDKNGIGWQGKPIDTKLCLQKLESIDKDGKMRFISGNYYWPEKNGRDSDTAQRQISLDAASEDADWVLQIDSDEVLACRTTFQSCLALAQESGAAALHYPMRWLFCKVKDDLYLEHCNRFWTIAASYPGPVAVKAGTRLEHCRQTSVPHFRVDFKTYNTDPGHPRTAQVDSVIDPSKAIWHFSLVRDEGFLLKKSESSTHAKDFSWAPIIERWRWAQRHPILTMASTPFLGRASHERLRLVRVNIA